MSGTTILVADDESHIRYVLKYKLEKHGYNVLTASDGEQAYELACREHPHLVISDYQMPGCNGLDLCIRLAANPDTAETPALLLTARGHKVPPSRLMKTNIKCVMAKPFSPRELIASIKELLVGVSHPLDSTRSDEEGAEAA